MTIQEIAAKHFPKFYAVTVSFGKPSKPEEQYAVDFHQHTYVMREEITGSLEAALRELLEACCKEVEMENARCSAEAKIAKRDARVWRAKAITCWDLAARLRKLGGE